MQQLQLVMLCLDATLVENDSQLQVKLAYHDKLPEWGVVIKRSII